MNEQEVCPEGRKDDGGKNRLDLIPPEVILALGQVMTWRSGEVRDPESGMPHLWHVLTNAAFMVYLEGKP